MNDEQAPETTADAAITALLALDSTAPTAASEIGATLSDEQLAALVAGELDATARQRLLDAIATSPALYQRWVRAIEAQDALTPGPEEQTTAAPAEGGGRWQQWLRALSDWLRRPVVLGGAIAAALAVVLLPGGRDSTGDIDALYRQWQPALTAAPTGAPSQWRGDHEAGDKAAGQRAFEAGLSAGLQQLGDGFTIVGLPRYRLTGAGATAADGSPLAETPAFAAGRITALLYFYCRQTPPAARDAQFFEAVGQLLNVLPPAAQPWRYATAENPTPATDSKTQAASVALCEQSQVLINRAIKHNR